jgi:hypothetical protein
MTERFDEKTKELAMAWHDGGSVIPYVEALVDNDEFGTAGMALRLALMETEDADEAAKLERLIDAVYQVSEMFDVRLREFEALPTQERWDALIWEAHDPFYGSKIAAARLAKRGKVDFDMLFRCATARGWSADVIDIVRDGHVSPAVVLERAKKSPIRANWLLLAADAARATGQDDLCVTLAKQALEGRGREPLVPHEFRALCERAEGDLRKKLEAVETHVP